MSKLDFRDCYGRFVVLLAVCVILTIAPSLMAQTAGSGALTGVVSDSTGAVVPGATVTVTSVDTGQVRTASTGQDGSYTVNLLPPGNYQVKFEASGFQTGGGPAAKVTV